MNFEFVSKLAMFLAGLVCLFLGYHWGYYTGYESRVQEERELAIQIHQGLRQINEDLAYLNQRLKDE